MGKKNYRRLFVRLSSPLILIVLLLFFFSHFSNLSAIIERPLSSVGTWLNLQWLKWFPVKLDRAYCAADDSDILLALAVNQAEFEELKIENENLRRQLGFFERQSFQFVPAKIIKRSVSPLNAIFILDRGADDGLIEGSAVIVSDGHLIGKVLEVKAKNAVVQSVLGRDSKVAVSLFNSSRTLGLCEGNGGALLSLNFIPQDENIDINDLVVTSGLEEAIPFGLIVGVITGVERDQAAPFQTATVEPLVDARQYSAVSVVILNSDL